MYTTGKVYKSISAKDKFKAGKREVKLEEREKFLRIQPKFRSQQIERMNSTTVLIAVLVTAIACIAIGKNILYLYMYTFV